MRSRAVRSGWVIAAAIALSSGAARAERAEHSSLDLLRSASVAPTADGLELTVTLTEAELGELGRSALEDYLRSQQPRLFSRLSLGMVRYLDPRLVAKRVSIAPHPRRANHLGLEVGFEMVADAQQRKVSCVMNGWELSCETRWIDWGTAVIARVDATAELTLSLRRGATLAGRPVKAEISIRRIRGGLALAGLANLDLSVDLDPPFRAHRMQLGLPPSNAALRERFAGVALRRLRVASAGKDRVVISALIGLAAAERP